MDELNFPDSVATDMTQVRGIQVPPGHAYERDEEWCWVEVNEAGAIITFRLQLHVEVEPPEPEEVSGDDTAG